MTDQSGLMAAVDDSPKGGGLRALLGENLRQYGIMLALVLIVIFFAVWTDGRILMPNNLWTLVQQNAYVLILALGMLMVIIAGHIDLSVGSVVAFIGGVVGWLMFTYPFWHSHWYLAVGVGLGLGLIVGVWQGFWVAFVRIPAFVVTLAGMLLFRGLAQIVASRTMAGFEHGFNQIAGGSLPNFLGFAANPLNFLFKAGSPFGQDFDVVTLVLGLAGIAAIVITTLRSRQSQLQHNLTVESRTVMVIRLGVIGLAIFLITAVLSMNLIGGTPIVLVIVGALIFIYSFVTSRTTFGRHVYAVGGNRNAALLSGVKTARVDFLLFVNMGLLAAVAAIVTTSRAGAAVAAAGQNYELDAIASCFIGGTAVSGGIGKVGGAMVGALIMGVLNMGLSIRGIDANTQMAIKGLVLLLAVAFDLVSKRRSGVS
ncbi:MAG: sugar ABC transporter permease [Propionibacteriaceae bacterium]|jgi:putative multiple sugar transport system permease protein|nr:sugar ABC transporter permease [Propionibacteriaceae bacterium]